MQSHEETGVGVDRGGAGGTGGERGREKVFFFETGVMVLAGTGEGNRIDYGGCWGGGGGVCVGGGGGEVGGERFGTGRAISGGELHRGWIGRWLRVVECGLRWWGERVVVG